MDQRMAENLSELGAPIARAYGGRIVSAAADLGPDDIAVQLSVREPHTHELKERKAWAFTTVEAAKSFGNHAQQVVCVRTGKAVFSEFFGRAEAADHLPPQ